MSHQRKIGFGSLTIAIRRSFVILSAVFVFSCVELYNPNEPPSNVFATIDQFDRIVVSWNEVELAGVYSVYRSGTETGAFEYIGSTTTTSFIDVAIAPLIDYWYVVSAIVLSGDIEYEQQSAPVVGRSMHVFMWSTSVIAAGAVSMRIVADPTESGAAVIASAGDGESDVEVQRYTQAGGWQGFGASPARVTGDESGPFDVIATDGLLYLVAADRLHSGKLSVFSSAIGDAPEWIAVGDAGFGAASTGSASIVVSGGTPTVATRIGGPLSDPPTNYDQQSFQFTGAGWVALGVLPLTAAPDNPEPSQLKLVADGGTPILVIEDESDPMLSAIRIYEYSSSWVETTQLDAPGGAGILDGTLSVDFGASLIVTFIDEVTGIEVREVSGITWTDLAAPMSPDMMTGTLAVTADSQNVYIFYRDAVSLSGTVAKRAEDWSIVSASMDSDGLTGDLNVASLCIDTFENRVFAGYIDGGGFGAVGSAAIYQ